MPDNPFITRHPGGLALAQPNTIAGQIPFPDPNQWIVYENDFFTYLASDWTVTETQAGATQGVASGLGGWYQAVNSAANADVNSIQSPILAFTPSATKQFILRSRFKISNATNGALLIGVAVTDTSPIASLPSDGIFFYKAAATTALIASFRTSSSSLSVAVGNMADDTFVDVALFYRPGFCDVYLNDSMVGSMTALTTFPAGVPLATIIALANGTAAANTLTVDHIMVAQER